jgi:hypothetical protein
MTGEGESMRKKGITNVVDSGEKKLYTPPQKKI